LYDFITLFKSIHNNKYVPDTIKTTMKLMFTTGDFIVFKKSYYKNLYNKFKGDKRYKKNSLVYKKLIKQYHKLYSNKSHKLSKKIIQNFYNKPGYTKPKGEKCIETYSLDKRFVESKLPQIFRQLVNK